MLLSSHFAEGIAVRPCPLFFITERSEFPMIEMITNVNSAINGFVWGPIMLALLVGTGVYLTFRTNWIQVR